MLPNWATERMLGALLGALAFRPSNFGASNTHTRTLCASEDG